jgi:hypothetical protein
VFVAVLVGVGVLVRVLVAVGMAVRVLVGVLVRVPVAVGVLVRVLVAVGVLVRVLVAVGVLVRVLVSVGVLVGGPCLADTLEVLVLVITPNNTTRKTAHHRYPRHRIVLSFAYPRSRPYALRTEGSPCDPADCTQ